MSRAKSIQSFSAWQRLACNTMAAPYRQKSEVSLQGLFGSTWSGTVCCVGPATGTQAYGCTAREGQGHRRVGLEGAREGRRVRAQGSRRALLPGLQRLCQGAGRYTAQGKRDGRSKRLVPRVVGEAESRGFWHGRGGVGGFAHELGTAFGRLYQDAFAAQSPSSGVPPKGVPPSSDLTNEMIKYDHFSCSAWSPKLDGPSRHDRAPCPRGSSIYPHRGVLYFGPRRSASGCGERWTRHEPR